MIAIINKGGDPLGYCSYDVMINDKKICSFGHDRMRGLANCLRAASDAVEAAKWMDFKQEMDKTDDK